jgi:hypothetical protein
LRTGVFDEDEDEEFDDEEDEAYLFRSTFTFWEDFIFFGGCFLS